MGLLSFGAGGLVEASSDDVAGALGFVSGFTLFTAQSTAPTGWTKGTTHDNKALRLVTGAASSGGSNPFSASFASRSISGTISAVSLSTAQLASHTHGLQRRTNVGPAAQVMSVGATTAAPTIQSDSEGSGSTHDHTLTGDALDFAVTYVDVIMIEKD